MNFFSDRRWINPSQPKWLQWATWLVYWSAFWSVLYALDSGSLDAGDPGRRTLITVLHIALVPLAIFGGSDMAMGKRRGYYMCIAVAVAPFVIRFVGNVGYFEAVTVMRWTLFPVSATQVSSIVSFAAEAFLLFCLFHDQSRRYARIWLDS